MKAACHLKQPRGWFAAGEGFRRALGLLSDGAFKLFAFICLHAERPGGELSFERAEMERSPGKSRSALGRHLAELAGKGVGEIEPAVVNEHLERIMKDIHGQCVQHGQEEDWINYVRGANVAGFVKIADAMLAYGSV